MEKRNGVEFDGAIAHLERQTHLQSVEQVGNGGTGAGGATGGGGAGSTGNNGLANTTTVVTASAAEITVGSSVTFTAAITPAVATGSVSFFANGTFLGTATVTGGVAAWATTTLAAGIHSILAGYIGDGNYNGSQSIPRFEVVDELGNGQTGSGGATGGGAAGTTGNNGLPNTTTIVSAPPSNIVFGSSATFTAVITPAAANGTVAFFSNEAFIGTAIVLHGVAQLNTTMLAVGADSIVAGYSGNPNYNGSQSAPVVSTVAKATPVISWAAPPPIELGIALSSTQLNATANVPGTFVYSPAIGASPVAGSATLSVVFTPTDTTDYKTATATVTLSVASFALSENGAATQTVTAGAAATFNLTVSPVGSTTLLDPVTLTVAGLPAGATATFSPATIPAGSAAMASKLVVQTSASSAAWIREPQGRTPHRNTPILLTLLLLPLLGMYSLRNRMQRAPCLLALVLFAALSLGISMAVSGCGSGSAGGRTTGGSTSYNLVVTEASGTVTDTFHLTLVVVTK
jgi:hypothetical protein